MKRHRGCGVKLEILSSGKECFNNNVRAEDEKKIFFNFFHYYRITQFLFLPIFPKIFLEIIEFFIMTLSTATFYNLLKSPWCLFAYVSTFSCYATGLCPFDEIFKKCLSHQPFELSFTSFCFLNYSYLLLFS